MNPYAPVAIFVAVAVVAALAFSAIPGLLAQRKPNAAKSDAYECGVEPTSSVGGRFPVKFYLIAMLFVILDVEAVSFYPWAVLLRHDLRLFGFYEVIAFIVVLAVGYAYVWKNRGFEWK